MKNLKEYIKEGLFDDLEEIEKIGGMESNIKQLKKEIEEWIKENYYKNKLKISNKPNKDGLYEVTAENVEVKSRNNDITSLTNGLFIWKEVNDFFICTGCKNLTSLEGAPKKVGGDFSCAYCTSLESLEGCPKEVGGWFSCAHCNSLSSLKGAPEKVDKDFSCFNCKSLKSLEGAPKEVEEDFYCSNCISLKSLKGCPEKVGEGFSCNECKNLSSLKGAPKEVGGDFNCCKCGTQFTEDDVKKVSNVKGNINC